MDNLKEYIPLLTRILILCIALGIIYFISTTLVFYILPFILGWMIASFLDPVIIFFSNALKISRNQSTIITLFLFLFLTGSFFILIGGIIIVQLTNLSMYLSQVYTQNHNLIHEIEHLYIQLPPTFINSFITNITGLLENFTIIIGKLISSLLSFISTIPQFLVFLFVTIISTFFMARDKPIIKKFIVAQLSQNAICKSRLIKSGLFSALTAYIKAQLILMLITFLESTIGLMIIGIDYFILIAFLASIIDALPILGTGCVYIPLILWKLLQGSFIQGMGLLFLYLLILLVRQILEPKILGSQMGIYPLITLMAMYIGLKLFGILGLMIGPVSVVIFINLQNTGLIPPWKKY
ncbi:sporulation integral membrane protein YtvI [Inediibacterium massiliense]|uniref:sporulation integral membrane protein YtvI n=1 Tax=Inediibacterium massiliense TaxID=1658111 RepID=UPI0006B50D92|nr:sporulation integral membrane protein YtvI [Inediibacterium massiliense]